MRLRQKARRAARDHPRRQHADAVLQPCNRSTDWDSASQSDTARFAKYFWGLIDRGVYMPCSQYEALFVSAAHSEADVQATIKAAEQALTG